MKIHNQPSDGSFAESLQNLLSSNSGEFYGISAFAKNSGVLMLEKSINAYRKNGGKTTFIVGIDLNGTSIEALKNLWRISDNLFIVHSENNITFHPKMYFLKDSKKEFLAIGSNNLTKGGLFNNYESSIIIESSDITNELKDQLMKVVSRFTDPTNNTVMEINSDYDIENLLNQGYIRSEAEIQKELIISRSHTKNRDSRQIKLFGNEKMIIVGSSLPVDTPNNTHLKESNSSASFNVGSSNTQNDFFWFESVKMTGGSRNILDLSKTATLAEGAGTAQDTIYYKDATHVRGGVLFFDVNPDLPSEKEITINYDGVNYYPATIKYAHDNSNWRIQIKGIGDTGNKITDVLPVGSMVDKILVFEKVNSDNYILTIHPDEELDAFKENSLFWATNGRSKSGRKIGYIIKELEE